MLGVPENGVIKTPDLLLTLSPIKRQHVPAWSSLKDRDLTNYCSLPTVLLLPDYRQPDCAHLREEENMEAVPT